MKSERKIINATKPLVSVIIPVYNGEAYLVDAVGSIQQQHYEPIEIIAVDDGSTDGTAKIIADFGNNVRYVYQSNSGPAAARNRGLRMSKGDVIAFLDADDLWPENNLNLLVDKMLNNPEIEAIRGYAQLMEYNVETGKFYFVGNPKESFSYSIGAGIYRRSAFMKVGLFDTTLKFGEDSDWFIRANELNLKVKRLEDITLLVRRHGKNMTHGKSLVELNTLNVLKKVISRKRAGDRETQDTQQLSDK